MYYLALEDKPAGPFDLEQIRSNWRGGALPADTLYWQDGMPEWLPLETIRHLLDDRIRTAPMLIGGFWRRLAAFAADVLILCAGGSILGIFLFSFFTKLDFFGPLFGLAIATAYFGILNSGIGDGQTVGKRLFGLRVVDGHGRLVTPDRAVWRILLLWGPYAIYGMVAVGYKPESSIYQELVFGWAGALAYLYLFNRKTRQTIHDLAVGTYVVRASSPRPALAPTIARGHRTVAAIITGFIVIFLISTEMPRSVSHGLEVERVKQAIYALKNVRTVDLSESSDKTGRDSITICSLKVRLATRPKSMQAAEAQIAAAALKGSSFVNKKDRLRVTVFYGYDIGIGSETISSTADEKVTDWIKNPVPEGP